MAELDTYKSIVFDCDGVILDSNEIKTEAFYHTAQSYGEDLAQSLVAYHIANGGVSRYKKLSHFLNSIVPSGKCGPDLKEMLTTYGQRVTKGLMSCEIDSGIFRLRELTPSARWFVVSGGDQRELRKIFAARSLDYLFDGGIFGSPDSKELILKRELREKRMNKPGLLIGDSRYDYRASQQAGLDFIFVHHWTELDDWEVFCDKNKIRVIQNLKSGLTPTEETS